MSNRPEVVEALVAALDADNAVSALAAMELQFSPPPTAAEQDEARGRVRAARDARTHGARGDAGESS